VPQTNALERIDGHLAMFWFFQHQIELMRNGRQCPTSPCSDAAGQRTAATRDHSPERSNEPPQDPNQRLNDPQQHLCVMVSLHKELAD
jgi:hypothetical protein